MLDLIPEIGNTGTLGSRSGTPIGLWQPNARAAAEVDSQEPHKNPPSLPTVSRAAFIYSSHHEDGENTIVHGNACYTARQ